ncbi:MAG: hypothetical protein ABI702_14555 [Burkholderiales bacterium]
MGMAWILGVVLVALPLGLLVLRLLRRESEHPSGDADLPLWEAEEHAQRSFWPELSVNQEETMPAVLSPPEWKSPRSVGNSADTD